MQALLRVDGRAPGYSNEFATHRPEVAFRHFLTTVRGQFLESAFLFGTPEVVDPSEPSSTETRQDSPGGSRPSTAGQICVEIDVSREDNLCKAAQGASQPLPTTSRAPSVQQAEGAYVAVVLLPAPSYPPPKLLTAACQEQLSSQTLPLLIVTLLGRLQGRNSMQRPPW